MLKIKHKPMHYGLYGENDFLLTDFIHCEQMETRTRLYDNVIDQHIHTSLFQLYVLEIGRFELFIDANHQRIINGPAIVTIPENILHGMNVRQLVKGKVLTLSTSLLETLFIDAAQILHALNDVHIINQFDSIESFDAINNFATGICDEMDSNLTEKKMVIQNYCNLLLSLLPRLIQQDAEKIQRVETRNLRYYKLFQKKLKQPQEQMWSVKQYAQALSISSVHLNRICQTVVGKSALQIIHQHLVLQAEKMLKLTVMTVSEIAYQLNFEDPAYFSRLFRKHTGLCPKDFRAFDSSILNIQPNLCLDYAPMA
jgi:AraC family transcriptional regulator, transcriptional activator of pobA